MLRTERVAIEEHTKRRILEKSMRPAFCQIRVVSPRQLPTDHDYAVSTREYQSDQPSQQLLDWRLALSSLGFPHRTVQVIGDTRLSLLTPASQNAPRPQGFAPPRPNRAPLTAPGRSEKFPCLRRKAVKGKTRRQNNIVLFIN
jgi:hypothetical protein